MNINGMVAAAALALAMSAPAGWGGALEECRQNAASNADEAQCMALQDAALEDALKGAMDRAIVQARALDATNGGNGVEIRLLAAQQAWLAFRRAQCALVGATFGGGSGGGRGMLGCRIELTEARLKQLVDVLP